MLRCVENLENAINHPLLLRVNALCSGKVNTDTYTDDNTDRENINALRLKLSNLVTVIDR